MAERLRARSGKKLSYNEDANQADWETEEREKVEIRKTPTKKKKQKAEACTVCSKKESLIFCPGCQEAYHPGCLFPPLKVAPHSKWSCPQCVDPLSDIEKFLDRQDRLPELMSNGGSAAKDAPSSSLRPSKHYLVKWKSKSHLHCSWICEADIEKAGKSFPGLKMKLNNFRRQIGTLKGSNLEEDWGPIRSEWTTVDRILAHRQTGGIKEYLAKWKELGYEEATWEVESDIAAFQEQISRYNSIKAQTSGTTSKKRKGSTLANSDSKRWRKDFKAFVETPQFLSGGVLHPYQLEGLNFLRFAWRQGKHVILADEMGLGKTIQSISFLASLKAEGVSFPHLVVAPLSTLRNWEREFAIWAPHLNTVMYVGSGAARAIIREHEFYHPKVKPKMKKKKKFKRKKGPPQPSKQDRIKFDILLTSYEMINLDTATLKPIKWECLVVDEGHRLKNKESKLFQTLTQYITKHRVLLTGTPLQNNMDELFMLMHFLDAGKFASLDEFQQEFNDINQEEQISRLHKMLAPHLLRRVKKDVMKDMPPKKELILRVELSPLQKEYYKAILTKNYEALSRRGGAQISLNNVIMELRKLCGHPYLLEGVEPVVRKVSEAYRQLLEASGKLMLLDKIMVKLKADGHRVLIYSQFKQMLDILEDWLIYKNWTFERIDGSISGSDRQIRIDRFNAKDSTRFCFLLSTRAGGLGINLATADTVIIYDSDWNPHADLQAMARAHRLGQTKKVMIFRLVTRGSIEERMMQLSKKKMVLEHLVVGRLKTQQVLNQEELDDILRYGAKELFAEENDETKSQQIRYDDAAIDRLLDRSQVENEDLNGDDDDRDLLKAFKVANFEYVDEDEATAEGSDAKTGEGAEASDPNGKAKYWDDLLKDRFEEHKYEMLTELGKGKRTRKQVMHLAEDDLAGMSDVSSDDDEEEKEKETDNSPLETARATKETNEPVTKKPQSSKKRTRDLEPSGPPPLLEGEAKSLKVLGFNRRQRATFVQVLMRFGLGDFSWSEFIPRLKPKTLEDIKEYGNLFLGHISEEITESEAFSDGVPKEGLCVQDVLVRLAILHLIQDKVKCFLEDCSAPLFLEEVHSLLPGLDNTKFWNETHDRKLLEALLRHGYGRWHEIADDASLGFDSVVCKELQLPSVSPDVAAPPSNAVSQDTINKENLERNPEQDIPPQGSDGTSHPGSGSNTKDIQLHRKVAEFIKKRATVLERALNAEYHREALAEQREREESGEESTLIEDFPVENDTPFVALFMEEILRNAYDNDPRRLDMARMFNEMCKLVLERETDACETYTGNKSAGIRVRKISREIDSLCTELRRMISPFLKDGVGVHINGASGATAATNQQGASTHLFDCEDQELEGEVESEGDDIATPSQQPVRINQKPPSMDKMHLDGPCVNLSKESSHSFTPAEKSSTFFRAPQPSPKVWPPVVILDD